MSTQTGTEKKRELSAQFLSVSYAVYGISTALSPVRFAVVLSLSAALLLGVFSVAFRVAGSVHASKIVVIAGFILACLCAPVFLPGEQSSDLVAVISSFIVPFFLVQKPCSHCICASALSAATLALAAYLEPGFLVASRYIVACIHVVGIVLTVLFMPNASFVSKTEGVTARSIMLTLSRIGCLAGFMTTATPTSALPSAATGTLCAVTLAWVFPTKDSAVWRACLAVASSAVLQSIGASSAAAFVAPSLWASAFLNGVSPPPGYIAARPIFTELVVALWAAFAAVTLGVGLVAARELEGALYLAPVVMISAI